jgi:hypothetical protein
MVPFTHGQWLAERLSSSDPHLVDGEGHLSLAAQACEQGFAELRRQLNG